VVFWQNEVSHYKLGYKLVVFLGRKNEIEDILLEFIVTGGCLGSNFRLLIIADTAPKLSKNFFLVTIVSRKNS
jgi:hypothetical protein